MSWGLTLLILGLFEKMVVADGLLGPVANSVFSVDKGPGFSSAWVGTLAFSGQIFCDFAGYSTCAIGVGICLGFKLPENFSFPYAAVGFRDFWKRWHITLSTWLRDYLYIPLGGSRKSRFRSQANVMATMLVGGLWHGASWTFVVWGGLHGVFILIERFVLKVFGKSEPFGRFAGILKIPGALLTFLAVCFGWVFFRAQDFSQAMNMLRAMIGLGGGADQLVLSAFDTRTTLSVVVGILLVHWLMRERRLKEVWEKVPWGVRALAIGFFLTSIVVFSGDERAFIYFQF
jgi:D-alanyl-lipoteichoic acid acyltransferase DltB (MBOAT superfamily)